MVLIKTHLTTCLFFVSIIFYFWLFFSKWMKSIQIIVDVFKLIIIYEEWNTSDLHTCEKLIWLTLYSANNPSTLLYVVKDVIYFYFIFIIRTKKIQSKEITSSLYHRKLELQKFFSLYLSFCLFCLSDFLYVCLCVFLSFCLSGSHYSIIVKLMNLVNFKNKPLRWAILNK
jgi:hypothetical protein